MTYGLRRSPRVALAGPSLGALGVAASVLFFSSGAAAQTWAGARSTPVLGELVAVDATGEPAWPYGFEDIEGNGDAFQQTEQSLDIRTAYAATDASAFWSRVYVSDPNNVGGNVTVYVFIDNDETTTTGCGADATEVDPALTEDPTAGGYEYVIAVRGNGARGALYECQPSGFAESDPLPAGAVAEGGSDLDPINIGADARAYVQATSCSD